MNAVELPVTDSQTNSEGYSRGLYVNYTVSGVKTGITCSNDVSAIYIYNASKGSATYSGTYNCIDLNLDSTAKATGGNNFIRVYGHGAAADHVISILGHGATYLLRAASAGSAPFTANTHAIDSHSLSSIIAVNFAGTPGYIPVFADVPA